MTKLNWLTWESVILTKPSRDLKILGTETFIIKVTTLTELFPNMDHIANSDGDIQSGENTLTEDRNHVLYLAPTSKSKTDPQKHWPWLPVWPKSKQRSNFRYTCFRYTLRTRITLQRAN